MNKREKELFQETKEVLVNTVIKLEDNLLKAMENLQLTESAHIKAQEEIDGSRETVNMTIGQVKRFTDKLAIAIKTEKKEKMPNDMMNHFLQDIVEKLESLLDKVWDGSITDKDFRLNVTTLLCFERGENGVL